MADIFYFLIFTPLVISCLLTLALATIALSSYSRTGPKIKHAIENNFRLYAILAFLRLSAWSLIIFFFLALPGPIVLFAAAKFAHSEPLTLSNSIFASLTAIALSSAYAASDHLLYIPASLQLSCQFRFSRLLPLWRRLTPNRLLLFKSLLIAITLPSSIVSAYYSYLGNNNLLTYYFIVFTGLYTFVITWNKYRSDRLPVTQSGSNKFNIVMIGVDTLRIDKIGEYAYHRKLTPNIDKLCTRGVLFENCITPLARTAPSLTSFLASLWPHNHQIRDNYPDSAQTELPQDNLIRILNKQGYLTAAISDWAGADFKKINFGFKHMSVPEDQWNLKLLLRQGPAYLRLFLSLFTHNRFGKHFLPELYYLAGVPLTSHLGLECRDTITRLTENDQPFLINLFTSSTHVPFGSEYPYYNLFTPKDYAGDSRFIMGDLSTAERIVESQESGLETHDLSQIINLYDSCVKEFDDEVGKIIDHIEKCGLRDNTYIVLYSDHGTDFFETECWGQGNTLIGSDPSSRIPLIICGPGLPENVKFSHVCRSIDFMPTMLDILGMEIPKNIDGVSLLPYLKDNSNPNLYAYQETGVWMGKIPGLHPDQITYPDIIELLTIPDIESGTLVIDEKYYPTVIEAKNRSIQNDRWKLLYIPTYHGPVYQLYDLKNDPYRDVIDLYPDIVAELRPKLDEWIFSPTIQ
ncbi:sulfatase-like hydrolase/transferase [Methylomonas sp. LL1]|uniref:sulfatase-like hydrolase/transferase n=1 Tax=Methylomonas sp. LL1 TaxID=2785785 RepID=UPI0018C369F8|nr:sulfatase-like hydrolase/transferase [Methylomonas sp. LL1]QPK65322.1 sulfatase-like hydrolase/transferase [Methylomonas sp. LL1]CAG1023360.1 Ulvan-active sulfatase [Methylococcales bacterium]